jgi:hypothetical protein
MDATWNYVFQATRDVMATIGENNERGPQGFLENIGRNVPADYSLVIFDRAADSVAADVELRSVLGVVGPETVANRVMDL